MKLAKAPDERASARRFCVFSRFAGVPECSTLMRYHGKPTARRLDRTLFATVAAQLKTRAITIKTRTRTDATVIASASERQDDDQGMQHKGKPAAHGFKAHVGVDATSYLVEELPDLDQPQ